MNECKLKTTHQVLNVSYIQVQVQVQTQVCLFNDNKSLDI